MVRSGFVRWAGAMVVAGALAASCAAIAISPAAQADEGATETAAGQIAALGDRGEANAPQVRTLEDGTRIQLTPGSLQNGPYSRFRSFDVDTGYNIAVLDADNRGCSSCHTEGLRELVESMDYPHFTISNDLGTDMTPMDCMLCHNIEGSTKVSFGAMIHGIHRNAGVADDCMKCHAVDTKADGEMHLWEEVRFDLLQGIGSITSDNVVADVSYDQTTLTDTYTVNWLGIGRDTMDANYDRALADDPLDPEVFDTWTLSVSGLVNNPFEMTLPEIIAEAPSETFIGTTQCDLNGMGGELIENVELTGIPLSWFLEKAGVQDEALTARVYSIDGSPSTRVSLDEMDQPNRQIYIVYEINGERIQWNDGYPVIAWNTNGGLPIKSISEIVLIADPYTKALDGWGADGEPDYESYHWWHHKPNVGITHFLNGQIIPAGQPYEFEGYAQAYDEKVEAVEFSLDGGATWTRLDTGDSDPTKWVYWHFTFTPPEEPGAYVLQVRAWTESGMTSFEPDEVMFVTE